jgi:hypothetical protein
MCLAAVLLERGRMHVRLDGNIGSELLKGPHMQMRKFDASREHERNARMSRQFRGVEEHEFVNQAGAERRAIQSRPGFQ